MDTRSCPKLLLWREGSEKEPEAAGVGAGEGPGRGGGQEGRRGKGSRGRAGASQVGGGAAGGTPREPVEVGRTVLGLLHLVNYGNIVVMHQLQGLSNGLAFAPRPNARGAQALTRVRCAWPLFTS